MIIPSSSRKDANETWQTQKVNYLIHNPYILGTIDIDGDESAKLSTCRLRCGSLEYYPELDYASDFKLRILEDLINYRYRKNDYNIGIQRLTFETTKVTSQTILDN